MAKFKTREEWLNAANLMLNEQVFKPLGAKPQKKVRITCGWPSHKALATNTNKSRTLGQCWSPKASKDGTVEIMVTPFLDDPVRVLDVLTHEKVHEIVGNEHGHKAPFRALATQVGLEGKMTATVAGVELTKQLKRIAKELGKYPHATLDATVGQKKQTTRLIKCICEESGYTVRTTRTWIDQYGPPLSPVTGEPMVEEC